MNVARPCNADELRVKLCFFVNVRNANGLRVGGGSKIGNIVAICGLNAGGGGGRWAMLGIGWTGVANAGDDEKAFASWVLGGLAIVTCQSVV